MRTVTLYTTAGCGSCIRAKALLGHRSIPFEEVNLARDPVGRGELVARTGLMTFPQVVVDGHTVGGYDDLFRALGDGRLEELLAA